MNKSENDNEKVEQGQEITGHQFEESHFQSKRSLFFIKIAVLSGAVKDHSLLGKLRRKIARDQTFLRLKTSEKK